MPGHYLTSRFLTLMFILLSSSAKLPLFVCFYSITSALSLPLKLGHLSLFRIIIGIIIIIVATIIDIAIIIIIVIIATIDWINPQQVLTVPFWG